MTYRTRISEVNAVDSEIQLIMAFTIVGSLAIIALIFYIPLRLNSRNNALPIRTVEAEVVAKRSDVSFVQYGGHHGDSNAFADTRYFVTFQTENGERTELAVEGREYGMLAEGDSGQLTFQGTRYMGFERNVPSSEL